MRPDDFQVEKEIQLMEKSFTATLITKTKLEKHQTNDFS